MKKIPWINEGLVGFFEYDIIVYGFQLVGRTKEQLQQEVTHLLINQNYDRVNDRIQKITEEEVYSLSPEEQFNTNLPVILRNRFNDINYREQIKQQLLNEGVIYPDDISIEELGYNYRQYTQDEVNEITDFVTKYPSVTQVELEDIYLQEQSENVHYDIYQEKLRNALTNITNYENNLAISELLIQNYEKELAMEEQLISNSEMIVELYEAINSEAEGK